MIMNDLKYHQNKNIEDLLGEIWVDVFGYDGIYSVSNFGRIKSETRVVNNGQSGRVVKERILSQNISLDGRVSVGLCWNNICQRKTVNQIVWTSFNKTDIEDGKCIMHKNKIPSDNRLSNLECVSWSVSHSRNFELGLLPHLSYQKGSKWNKNNGIYLNGILTEKLCKKCFIHKPINQFSESYRNVCKQCRSISTGVKEFDKIKRIKELKEAGLKLCNKCETIKTLNEFYASTSVCKTCKKEYSKKKKRK